MHIAFHLMGSDEWVAGHLVLNTILKTLGKLGQHRPRMTLTVWDNQSSDMVKPWVDLADAIIRLPTRQPNLSAINRILRENGVQLFFSIPTRTAPGIECPRLLWIYDFQHRHYPKYFSDGEADAMDRLFTENMQDAARIMVNTRAVLEDLERFFPNHASKTAVLPLPPNIPTDICQRDPRSTIRHYGLPEKYFLLPNRFYPHKNHLLVVKALALACQRGLLKNIAVICTGSHAGRAAKYFEECIAEADRLKVTARFIALGSVPRSDYFDLLRQSLAIINPSKFEGFGLSVAESVYLGKPALLADIPVLHEHAHPDARYFNPDRPEALAQAMTDVADRADKGWQADRELSAFKHLSTAENRFARHFIDELKSAAHRK